MIIKSINILLLLIRYNILLIIVNIIGQQELNAVIALSEPFLSRRQSIRQCETPIIPNGLIKIRGRLARFKCKKTFQLIGTRYTQCTMGKWDAPIPVCAKDGCDNPQLPDNGYFTNENRGATVMLYCKDGYKVAGQRFAYCNGTKWDRILGECRATQQKSALRCDFETDDICGWTHDDSPEFEWKRKSGSSNLRRLHTGPIYDHTTKMSDNGHFMLLEPQDQKIGDQARLLSPVYAVNSNMTMCFRVWYYMLGFGVGTLRIYVKPMSIDIDTMIENKKYLYFELSGNQRSLWQEAFFNLEPTNEEFQIVIEGTLGSLHLSDIAIDDAALLTGTDCPDNDHKISSPTIEKEDENVITDIQTCENRCNETESKMKPFELNILIKNDQITKMCDCHMDCDISHTCCPDYRNICGFDATDTSFVDYASSNPTVETSDANYAQTVTTAEAPVIDYAEPLFTTETSIVDYPKPLPSAETPVVDIVKPVFTVETPVVDLAQPLSTVETLVIDYVHPHPTVKGFVVVYTKSFSTTETPFSKYAKHTLTTKKTSINNSLPITSKILLNSTTPLLTKTTSSTINVEISSDTNTTLKPTLRHLPVDQLNDTASNDDHQLEDKPYLYKINSVGSFLTFLSVLLVIITIVLSIICVTYRYYKKNFGPENYKNNNDKSGIRANSEFSEIRYLTSDDHLDFTLQTATNNIQQNQSHQMTTIKETSTALSSSLGHPKTDFDSSNHNKKTDIFVNNKKTKKLPKDKTRTLKQSEAEVKLLDDNNEAEDTSSLLDDYAMYSVCQ